MFQLKYHKRNGTLNLYVAVKSHASYLTIKVDLIMKTNAEK